VNNAPELGRPDNRLLAALPRETLASFGQDLKQVSLSQGAVCYEPGDRIDRVYFPISGMISLLVAGSNGEIVETGIIGREGAAGLQSALGERRSYIRATIQIPGHFAVISAAHFERVVSNSTPLKDLVFHYIETRWAEAQQIAACNAIHSGPPRLCRWLLQAADCTGAGTARTRSNKIQPWQDNASGSKDARSLFVRLLRSHQTRKSLAQDRGEDLKFQKGTKPMSMYYFHLSNDRKVPDVDGTDLSDRSAARTHAFGVARELMFRSKGMLDHDWSQWRMSVQDDGGNELFSFPLTDFDTGNGK
jgi:CRP-like cAMP-binding protein